MAVTAITLAIATLHGRTFLHKLFLSLGNFNILQLSQTHACRYFNSHFPRLSGFADGPPKKSEETVIETAGEVS